MADIVKSAPTERDIAAILGFADSLDGRQLVAEGNGDLLPYDCEFHATVNLIEVKAEKNYDSRGIRVKLRVLESDQPQRVKVNHEYTLWFFDQNKNIPQFVLAEMVSQRIVFAATIAGYDGDPLEELPDGTPKFKAATTLADLHREVEPLDLKMRLYNRFIRNTRNGKPLHKLEFEMAG